jgi:hypothetical protein
MLGTKKTAELGFSHDLFNIKSSRVTAKAEKSLSLSPQHKMLGLEG